MPQPQLKYYDLDEQVTAFSTTRHGGWSRGNYGELNINPYCGDEADAIQRNLEILSKELGIEEERLLLPHQVHGIESRMIAEELFTLPGAVRSMILDGADALMTDCRNVCIGVSTADCIPLILYDPRHHVSAVVHAGWRGTLNRIAHKVIVDMSRCYDTRPADVRAVLAPGIGLDNFEVGQEVYDQFAALGNNMERIAKMYSKWHIDLPLCNRIQLEEAGVPADHIMASEICTFDHFNDFFSARRLGINSGRIYTGIILR